MSKENGKSYSAMLKEELMEVARRLGLTRFSRLRKNELLDLVLKTAGHGETPRSRREEVTCAADPDSGAPPRKPKDPGAEPSRLQPAPGEGKGAGEKGRSREERPATARPSEPREPAKPAKPAKPAAPAEPAAPKTPSRARSAEELRDADQGLPELSDDNGENRIVLLPRDPSWLFAYWELQPDYKQAARDAGGETLALRLYDVTGKDFDGTNANAMFEHECAEWARSWYLPVPSPERDYSVEIGYRGRGEWFPLSRSNTVAVPADQPSTWQRAEFGTVQWEESLKDAQRAGAGQETGGVLLMDEPDLRIIAEVPRVAFPPMGGGGFSGELPVGSHVLAGSLGHQAGSAAFLPGSVGYLPGSIGFLPGSIGFLPGSVGHLPGSAGFLGGSMGHLPAGTLAEGAAGLAAMAGPGLVELPGEGEPEGPPLLQAAIEMIISGRSLPGTELTVAGRRIPLGPDGAFSLRISVPEGTRAIPLVAEEKSTGIRRTIQLVLGRELQR